MQNPEARDDQSKHAVSGITNGYPFIKEQGALKGPLVVHKPSSGLTDPGSSSLRAG